VKVCTVCLWPLPLDAYQKGKGGTLRGACSRCRSDTQRRYHYDITAEQYTTLLVIQNNVCGICEGPPQSGEVLVVDHCHDTGAVRGLLCSSCNKAIGLLKDRTELLIRAAAWCDDGQPNDPQRYLPPAGGRQD